MEHPWGHSRLQPGRREMPRRQSALLRPCASRPVADSSLTWAMSYSLLVTKILHKWFPRTAPHLNCRKAGSPHCDSVLLSSVR